MKINDFQGQLITAEDAEYDTARAIWNGAIQRYPRLIARCSGTADVAAAVRLAGEHDLEIAVRGGGHNVAGTATCEDGIVIDARTAMAGWLGERLDVGYAIDVLHPLATGERRDRKESDDG